MLSCADATSEPTSSSSCAPPVMRRACDTAGSAVIVAPMPAYRPAAGLRSIPPRPGVSCSADAGIWRHGKAPTRRAAWHSAARIDRRWRVARRSASCLHRPGTLSPVCVGRGVGNAHGRRGSSPMARPRFRHHEKMDERVGVVRTGTACVENRRSHGARRTGAAAETWSVAYAGHHRDALRSPVAARPHARQPAARPPAIVVGPAQLSSPRRAIVATTARCRCSGHMTESLPGRPSRSSTARSATQENRSRRTRPRAAATSPCAVGAGD